MVDAVNGSGAATGVDYFDLNSTKQQESDQLQQLIQDQLNNLLNLLDQQAASSTGNGGQAGDPGSSTGAVASK